MTGRRPERGGGRAIGSHRDLPHIARCGTRPPGQCDMNATENTTGLVEVLAAHSDWYGHGLHTYTCECGTALSTKLPTTEEAHRAHLADMLTQVIEAREAELRAEADRAIDQANNLAADLITTERERDEARAQVTSAAREAVLAFAEWVAYRRAYNGSDHTRGQSLYNESLNGVLPDWARAFADEHYPAARVAEGGNR